MEKSWFAENKKWIEMIVVIILFLLIVFYGAKSVYDGIRYPITVDRPLTKSDLPGTIDYNAKCNDGGFITGFNSKINDGVSQLSATCSNNQILGPFGTYTAGELGKHILSDRGFSKASIWYSNRVNGINVFNGKEYHTIGKLIGNENLQNCGDNGRIVGLKGNGDGYVSNLGIVCGYKGVQ